MSGRSCPLTAVERILVVGAGVVRDFYACPALVRVLEEVDIRAFVETVVARLLSLRAVEVVDISKLLRGAESGASSASPQAGMDGNQGRGWDSFGTYSVATFSSPGWTAILRAGQTARAIELNTRGELLGPTGSSENTRAVVATEMAESGNVGR